MPQPRSQPPSDWVSGERVFAPPSGTLDVDWLVPALLEAVPGTTPPEARAALERARVGGSGTPDGQLEAAADRVLSEARRSFRA